MPPDPPRLGVRSTPSLSTFINHHASKGPLLVKKNPPFKIPGYGPGATDVADVSATDVADVSATDVADVSATEVADVTATDVADV